MRAAVAMLMAMGALGLSAAQPTGVQSTPPSAQPSWQGEWGTMERNRSVGAAAYTGGRLSLSECNEQSCNMAIRVAARPDAYCETTATVTLESATTAVAHLPSAAEERCVLTLRREGDGAIVSEQRGAECSYDCTPGGSFAFTFPRRGTELFHGADRDACYAVDASSARMAICKDAELAARESEWRDRSREVGDLLHLPETAVQTPEQLCAASTAIAECLRTAYSQQIGELRTATAQWRAAETTPGRADEAEQKVRAIEGRYRKAVRNGDITGRHYQTTDVLTIRRASKTSIAYSVELFFYNGHECSRSGTAEYRQSGSFVEQSAGDAVGTDAAARRDELAAECFFEIRPTEKGIELADPTGVCRQSDCGARGGYGGEAFPFARRLPLKR